MIIIRIIVAVKPSRARPWSTVASEVPLAVQSSRTQTPDGPAAKRARTRGKRPTGARLLPTPVRPPTRGLLRERRARARCALPDPRAGIVVPKRLSIVGFDNLEIFRHQRPRQTADRAAALDRRAARRACASRVSGASGGHGGVLSRHRVAAGERHGSAFARDESRRPGGRRARPLTFRRSLSTCWRSTLAAERSDWS